MAVFIDKNTRLLVQGLTGREGTFHAKQAAAYGTTVVGGVTPGRAGRPTKDGPCSTPSRMREGDRRQRVGDLRAAARLRPTPSWRRPTPSSPLAVCITEGIPTLDMMRVLAAIRGGETRVIGPNCPGLITAGQAKAGIIPGHICKEGRVGIVSKSGTLTYEAIHQLTRLGLGQTTCIGIGGDPLIGTSFIDALQLFAERSGHRSGGA